MDNLSTSTNPYIIDEAVSDPVMFFGHTEVFTWLNDALKERETKREMILRRPFILHGPPGVGKSSILRQLERGKLGEDNLVIYFDIQQLPLDSLDDFLWVISSQINRVTLPPEIKILVPLVARDRFTANPVAAFDDFMAVFTKKRLENRQLILAFDDLDILAGQSQPGYVEYEILNYLCNLLQQSPNLTYIFTLNSPIQNLPENALAPFRLSKHFPVSCFSLDMTQEFLRRSALFNTSSVVGSYIFYLTGGHPGDIQRYCHKLYQRRQNNKLMHITLADVVAVTRQSKGSDGFQSPVLQRLAADPITVLGVSDDVTLPSRPPLKPKSKTNQLFGGRKLLVIVLFVILFIALGFVLFSRQNRPNNAITGDNPTNTAEPMASSTNAMTNVVILGDEKTAVPPTSTIRPSASATAVANLESTVETVEMSPTGTAIPPTPTEQATPSPEPTPLIVPADPPAEIVREGDDMPMLIVPEGTFIMGASDSNPAVGFDETPEHEVHISTFYMDKFEVTVSQFATFLNTIGTYDDACQETDCVWPREIIGYTSYLIEVGEDDERHYEAMAGFENYPINHVSWFGADSYCQSVGGRLPTEAEWEFAARGEDGRIYPWGNDPPNNTRAVYFSSSFTDLKPVDALPDGASPYGIYGLAGSMWEWVSDWYSPTYYQDSPTDNPQGPEEGEGKVSRGGAWPNNNQADRIRSTNRNWREAAFFSPDLGFRCAFTPDETTN